MFSFCLTFFFFSLFPHSRFFESSKKTPLIPDEKGEFVSSFFFSAVHDPLSRSSGSGSGANLTLGGVQQKRECSRVYWRERREEKWEREKIMQDKRKKKGGWKCEEPFPRGDSEMYLLLARGIVFVRCQAVVNTGVASCSVACL